jgi:hypothetical protein
MNVRQIGKFKIDMSQDLDRLAMIFAEMRVVIFRAEPIEDTSYMEFLGICGMFRESPNNELVPIYTIKVTRNTDEGGITVGAIEQTEQELSGVQPSVALQSAPLDKVYVALSQAE